MFILKEIAPFEDIKTKIIFQKPKNPSEFLKFWKI